MRPTDWCGEFKEAQTKPSLFTSTTTSIISASLPNASEKKLLKHKITLEEAIPNSHSKLDAERLRALLLEVNDYISAAYSSRMIKETEIVYKKKQQQQQRQSLMDISGSIVHAIEICKEANKSGLTWPREAAELANLSPLSDDEWSKIETY